MTMQAERSRRVMNVEYRGYNRKGVNYDWKAKVDQYLPHHLLPIVTSILFEPLSGECSIEATSGRSMAWLSAAVSSGAPLVFVNIQSEQIVAKEKAHATGRDITWGRQPNDTTTIQTVQGIRLWFLPGVAEMPLEMKPNPRDTRFGMDIKRTEEGFICVHTVALGSPADRSGLWHLHQEAQANGKLVVISRLEGKSLMPSSTSSAGLVNCCDPNDIRETLASAIDRMESIRLHIMAWPGQTPPPADGAATSPASGWV